MIKIFLLKIKINMKKYKLYITTRSKGSLNLYVNFLKKIFSNLDLEYSIFSYPQTRKRITLLKSPHVNKKAKETFEMHTYKKVFSFSNNSKILDILSLISKNQSQSVNIKISY
jgi:ribosomal protein S10